MQVSAFIDDDLKMSELFKARDLKYLAQVYDKHCAALFGVIYRMTGNKHLAEEILSNVYIKVWNQPGDFFTCGTSLFMWLLKIARELAIDAMSGEEEVNHPGDKNVDTANTISTAENAAFSKSSQMDAFDLLYYKGMSPGGAAAALDKSVAELRVDLRNRIKNLADKK